MNSIKQLKRIVDENNKCGHINKPPPTTLGWIEHIFNEKQQ